MSTGNHRDPVEDEDEDEEEDDDEDIDTEDESAALSIKAFLISFICSKSSILFLVSSGSVS